MLHRLKLILLDAILISLVLTSCYCLKKPVRNTLRIYAVAWITQKFKMKQAAADFMRKNPHIRVVIDTYDDRGTTFYPLRNPANAQKYDLFLGASREHIITFASAGLLQPFNNGFFDKRLHKEDFFPSFLELGNIEGKQYMIPLMGELMVLVIRKDLFHQAGLVDSSGQPLAPDSWDDLERYAQKLRRLKNHSRKISGINIDFGPNMLLYSFFATLQAYKGNIFNPKTLYLDTSSDSVQYILHKWQRLIRSGLTPIDTFRDPDAGRENFKKGNVAILLAPHSRWTECGAVLGREKVGLLPLPGAVKNGSLTYIHGIALSARTTQRRLALRFIKEELLSRDFQQWTMRHYGKIPSLIRNYDQNLTAEWTAIFRWIKDATTLPLYQGWIQFDTKFQREVQNYLLGIQSIAKTLSVISTELNRINKSTGTNF
jgi:ABC-type glycerol-3-phosphate transport system substrate-binding protein